MRRYLVKAIERAPRFGYWPPWDLIQPWRPRFWQGTDDFGHRAYSIAVPFIGAFHIWFLETAFVPESWTDEVS